MMSESIMNFVSDLPSVMLSGFHVHLSDSSCEVSSSLIHMLTGTELEGLIALATKYGLRFYVTSFAVFNGFNTCFCVYS